MPTTITVVRAMAFPRHIVWERLADIASHAGWMKEATTIEFTSAQRAGVGTVAEVPTRIGPFVARDRIEFTAWNEPSDLSVRHSGVISGTGTFMLDEMGPSLTTVTWQESIGLTLRLGGRLGELIARPIITRIWERNLRDLETQIAAVHDISPA
ncbi:polyketide cyclase / dehydrase and lipid transport [bacterium BMS3Bbin02]|nr:polyketide cyclase / dehydrase and lipid transport [bacterium BMS3Bbin02]